MCIICYPVYGSSIYLFIYLFVYKEVHRELGACREKRHEFDTNRLKHSKRQMDRTARFMLLFQSSS